MNCVADLLKSAQAAWRLLVWGQLRLIAKSGFRTNREPDFLVQRLRGELLEQVGAGVRLLRSFHILVEELNGALHGEAKALRKVVIVTGVSVHLDGFAGPLHGLIQILRRG